MNEITAVEGSTRLEAKKQRRREGRAAGRRRAPIVTEAEFLARRESVERTMVIRARGEPTQIAVSEDNVLVEHYVAQEEQVSLIGNVYLGRVQNVLPSMEAAFIDIGKGRNAVLYAGEVDWATLGGANGPRKIESVLKSGQAVLVQVTKDPIGHKGARLTNRISLPGRYVVYVPRGGNGGISRKLPDTERNRLKGILKDIVPDEAGVIVRTAAEGASEEELTADVSRLHDVLDGHRQEVEERPGPQAAVRRAGPADPGGPRPVHRGLHQAGDLRRRRLRPGQRVRLRRRAAPGRPGGAGPRRRATSSRTSGSTSRSRRRWTARSGCRPAVRWSSTGPRR